MKTIMYISALTPLLQKLPYLNHITNTYGEISVLNYGQAHYRGIITESDDFLKRKGEFLTHIYGYVSQKFDHKLANIVSESLSKNYVVSTAEHHGPLGHPFFFQSGLLRGLVNPDEAIINLCTSQVSLGNSSYPRGLVLHGDGENAPREYLHLPFFPASKRMSPVFGLGSYTKKSAEKCIYPKIHVYLENKMITEETSRKLGDFVEKYVLHETVLNTPQYSQQITALNNLWWGQLFPQLPPLISLDAEDIVSKILIKHIESNTVLAQMVTDEKIQPVIEGYFDGVPCCFEREKKEGSYLFWYLDEHNNRHPLWREGHELVSNDGVFRVKLDAFSILSHLLSGNIIPSGLLVYSTLSCYYGVTCFGGFSQGDYLPKIQQAYTNVLRHLPGPHTQYTEQRAILNEDIVFLHEKTGQISTALDLHLHGGVEKSKMLHCSEKVTIRESLEKMSSEIFRCL